MIAKNAVVSLVFALLLSGLCLAQIDVTVTKQTAVTGLVNARVVGAVVFADSGSPTLSEAAIIKVVSPAKFVRVKARKSLFETADLQKLSDTEYVLAGSGKYAVEVMTFDVNNGIDEKFVEVVLGEVKPDPKPDEPPAPQPVKSFRVIFVRESGQTLNSEQTAITGAKVIRDYLTQRTTPEGGLAGWREYDPQQSTANEQSAIKALWTATKSSITTVPCVIVEVNGKSKVIDYPKNTTEALKILKEYGGQ